MKYQLIKLKKGQHFTRTIGNVFNATRKAEISAKLYPAKRDLKPCEGDIKTKPLPTLERLKALYTCNTKTGELFHATKRGGMSKGDLAGTTSNGYLQTFVDGEAYRNHRLVWKFAYGVDPKHCIDHMDGNRQNNSIKNLREATPAINAQNKTVANSATGKIGVYYCHRTKLYMAEIGFRNTGIKLGAYKRKSCAIKARKLAEGILYDLPDRQAA